MHMRILTKIFQNHWTTQKQINNISIQFPKRTNHVYTNPQGRHVNSWADAILQDIRSPQSTIFKASQLFNSGAKPNSHDLICLLRVLKHQASDFLGQQLHCHISKSGYLSNLYVVSSLMSVYTKFENLVCAHVLFDEIPQPNVVCWNSLISGYVRAGEFGTGLRLFIELEKSGLGGDSYSFSAALSACGQMGMLKFGESVHGKVVKFGSGSSVVVGNCLIDMYGKCGAVEEGIVVFNDMVDKDVISWNSVIAACAGDNRIGEAFGFLHRMPCPDTISYNEVINGIAQFGDIDDAVCVLKNMTSPDSSSYNSILTGYVNRDRALEAMHFFTRMHSDNVSMDQFTYSVVLSGAARLAASTWGMIIHCCTIKGGFDMYMVIGSALIDMYSKCGVVRNAEMIFYSLPKKNLITWNAMISGYSHNGNFMKVIHLFELLKRVGDLKPNGITFLNVLSGCSHSQISLESAMQYFESMIKEYNIKPTVEHCCSMIRLMGHRGEIEKAEKMVYELGLESCGVVWRALLGASVDCKNLNIAISAAAKVMELGGDDDYVFVMMSNIHAFYGKWEDVRVLRKLMIEKGVRKEVGYSWIDEETALNC